MRLLLLLFCFNLALAQELIQLKPDVQFVEIKEGKYKIWVDSSNQATIDQVRKKTFAELPLFNKNPEYSYWLHCRILSEKNLNWVLEILDSRQQELEIYVIDSTNVFVEKLGQRIPFKQRSYGHKNFIIDLPHQGNTQEIYIKFKSPFVISMLSKIRRHHEFTSYALNEYYFLGFFYGLLCIIILYNSFLFLFVKERIYLYYAGFVLAWAFHSLSDDGIGNQYLWTDFYWVSAFGQLISRPLFVFFLIIYSIEFLSLKERYPGATKLIYLIYAAYLVISSMDFFWLHMPHVMNTMFIIPLLIIFYYAVKIFKDGFRPSRFFIIGNSFVLLGLALRILKDTDVLEHISASVSLMVFGIYSQNMGVFLEILVMTIALADRLRYLKRKDEEAQNIIIEQLKENEQLSQKVNRELEQKVNERTVQLQEAKKVVEEANEKLKAQADEIQRMNALLDLDNHKLKKKVQEVTEARVKFKDVSYEEFSNIFPNDLACQRYLEEIKWSKGYHCKKCNNSKFSEGVKKFSRRCTKCGYNESITAYTLLHKCKFPLPKAMYILMKVFRYGEKNSLNEMSEQLQLRKSTVWAFKEKVLEAMKSQKSKSNNFDDNLAQLILSSKVED
ncbi:MAG: hypothetical protein MUF42_01560 [Cytophagaceae bacterium]|jgi:hypothetical protein|nr:hypothetical protein [Cytophagaceae bacterium]